MLTCRCGSIIVSAADRTHHREPVEAEDLPAPHDGVQVHTLVTPSCQSHSTYALYFSSLFSVVMISLLSFSICWPFRRDSYRPAREAYHRCLHTTTRGRERRQQQHWRAAVVRRAGRALHSAVQHPEEASRRLLQGGARDQSRAATRSVGHLSHKTIDFIWLRFYSASRKRLCEFLTLIE